MPCRDSVILNMIISIVMLYEEKKLWCDSL